MTKRPDSAAAMQAYTPSYSLSTALQMVLTCCGTALVHAMLGSNGLQLIFTHVDGSLPAGFGECALQTFVYQCGDGKYVRLAVGCAPLLHALGSAGLQGALQQELAGQPDVLPPEAVQYLLHNFENIPPATPLDTLLGLQLSEGDPAPLGTHLAYQRRLVGYFEPLVEAAGAQQLPVECAASSNGSDLRQLLLGTWEVPGCVPAMLAKVSHCPGRLGRALVLQPGRQHLGGGARAAGRVQGGVGSGSGRAAGAGGGAVRGAASAAVGGLPGPAEQLAGQLAGQLVR